MTDPFDMTSSRQRGFVLVVVLAYFALFAVAFATDNPDAAALSDLLITVLAVPASALVIRRATVDEEIDWIALVAAVAFLLAGLAIGYSGLAQLTTLDAMPAVESAGSLALLFALVLYLYRSYQ